MVANRLSIGQWIRVTGRPALVIAILGDWITVEINYRRLLVRREQCYQF